MNNNCIIKLIFLTGVIYLIISSCNCTEKFTTLNNKSDEVDTDEVDITLIIDNVEYVFISFDNLKSTPKNKVIEGLKNNINYMRPPFGSKSKAENFKTFNDGPYEKIPIFIVERKQFTQLTMGPIVSFKLIKYNNSNTDFKLTPIISGVVKHNEYLFDDQKSGLLYYTNSGDNHVIINNNDFKINKTLLPKKFGTLNMLNVLSNDIVTTNDNYKVNITKLN